jgi:hypothetical protein
LAIYTREGEREICAAASFTETRALDHRYTQGALYLCLFFFFIQKKKGEFIIGSFSSN